MNKKYFFKVWFASSAFILLWLVFSLIRYRQKEKWAKKIVEGWHKKYRSFDDDPPGSL